MSPRLTHVDTPHASPRSPFVIVVVFDVHVIPSGDVHTVEPVVPTTHLPPPHAIQVAFVTVWRNVHVMPSADVKIDVAPAAAHIQPFHAIAD